MLDGIMAEYYGNPTPINRVANISALDARTITVQPRKKYTFCYRAGYWCSKYWHQSAK